MGQLAAVSWFGWRLVMQDGSQANTRCQTSVTDTISAGLKRPGVLALDQPDSRAEPAEQAG